MGARAATVPRCCSAVPGLAAWDAAGAGCGRLGQGSGVDPAGTGSSARISGCNSEVGIVEKGGSEDLHLSPPSSIWLPED